jgi:hypothetical protein
VETVAEIIGDEPHVDALPARLEPIVPEGALPFPVPGIYLGMPDEDYHRIFACSASGLKAMSVSSMDAWAMSLLNAERQEKDPRDDGKLTPMELGRAYHTFICEGEDVFNERYAVALNKDDVRADTLKRGLPFCVTIADIRLAIDVAGGKPKGTGKDALIEQLLELGPAVVWDRVVSDHGLANAGKVMISDTLYRRIQIANAMITKDPQLKDAFTGGFAEVSIFWFDEQTGLPCKARLDYLKMNHVLDLKSFSNKQRKPIQRAIDMAISYEKYFLAIAFYLRAIEAAKKLVRDTKGGGCTFALNERTPGGDALYDPVGKDMLTWLWQWAHQPEPECLWVYQQVGVAPVTRGRIMTKGSTLEVNRIAMTMLMKKWRHCMIKYSTDPWLDLESVRATVDEELTWAATDFGDIDIDYGGNDAT